MNNTKKVLVFTNKNKWKTNIDKTKIINNWDQNYQYWVKYPVQNNPIVECFFSNNQTILDYVNLSNPDDYVKKDGIFLVFDEIDKVYFDNLKKMCKDNELYVLTHSNGRAITTNDFPKAVDILILPGTHNNDPNDRYYPIFKILGDNTDNKMDRIINEVFKTQLELETVLLFLHGCLGDSRSNGFDESYQKLRSISSIQGSVTDFYNKYFADDSYNGQNGGNKTADLATLRNKLLKYVSIQA